MTRTFEIQAPDGRIIRQQHASLEHARAAVTVPGYGIVGEVLGASTDGKGGWVDPVGPGAVSLMGKLLEAHGPELLEWLEKNFRGGRRDLPTPGGKK